MQLHGATIQEDALGRGDALTPNDESEIVRELKAIGANAARAQHPLDPGLLERLDAAGILVWQGVGPVEGAGNWFSNTPALLADAERQARHGGRRLGKHCTRRSSPGISSTRSRATAATAPRSTTCSR